MKTTFQDNTDSLQDVQHKMMNDAERGTKIEKKLALHFGGYQQRSKVLKHKIREAADALEQAKTSLNTFRTLQVAEEAAIPNRLGVLRSEVEFVARREREAQQLYRSRKEELDGLSINGYH